MENAMFNIQTFNQLVVAILPVAGLVTALVQVAKITLDLSQRYIPLAALLIGAIVGILLVQLSILGAFVGIAVGLASIGLWEVGTNTLGAPKPAVDPSNLG